MAFQRIKLPFKVKKSILALGSQTKNSVAFAEGTNVYLSPVHQDLDNPKDFSNFEKTACYFLKKKPGIIAYDLHPEYRSTKFALDLAPQQERLRAVQHHHAHIASCMADNGIKNQKVIAVAFDGTGLGSDNTLWGAEFFIGDYAGFRRAAHLRPIALLGAEAAIKQPWRLTLIWLFLAYGESCWDLDIKFIRALDRKKWPVLKNMYLSGFNSPLSSSMGRLFDAVAALVLAKADAHFEAELAIELEKLASRSKEKIPAYQFGMVQGKEGYILEPLLIFKGIIRDLKHNIPKETIAYRFHLTVAELTKKMLLGLRRDSGLNKVVLSGGVFQNRLLSRLLRGLLSREGFEVLAHRNIPCHDAGISLGQIAIVSHIN